MPDSVVIPVTPAIKGGPPSPGCFFDLSSAAVVPGLSVPPAAQPGVMFVEDCVKSQCTTRSSIQGQLKVDEFDITGTITISVLGGLITLGSASLGMEYSGNNLSGSLNINADATISSHRAALSASGRHMLQGAPWTDMVAAARRCGATHIATEVIYGHRRTMCLSYDTTSARHRTGLSYKGSGGMNLVIFSVEAGAGVGFGFDSKTVDANLTVSGTSSEPRGRPFVSDLSGLQRTDWKVAATGRQVAIESISARARTYFSSELEAMEEKAKTEAGVVPLAVVLSPIEAVMAPDPTTDHKQTLAQERDDDEATAVLRRVLPLCSEARIRIAALKPRLLRCFTPALDHDFLQAVTLANRVLDQLRSKIDEIKAVNNSKSPASPTHPPEHSATDLAQSLLNDITAATNALKRCADVDERLSELESQFAADGVALPSSRGQAATAVQKAALTASADGSAPDAAVVIGCFDLVAEVGRPGDASSDGGASGAPLVSFTSRSIAVYARKQRWTVGDAPKVAAHQVVAVDTARAAELGLHVGTENATPQPGLFVATHFGGTLVPFRAEKLVQSSLATTPMQMLRRVGVRVAPRWKYATTVSAPPGALQSSKDVDSCGNVLKTTAAATWLVPEWTTDSSKACPPIETWRWDGGKLITVPTTAAEHQPPRGQTSHGTLRRVILSASVVVMPQAEYSALRAAPPLRDLTALSTTTWYFAVDSLAQGAKPDADIAATESRTVVVALQRDVL